MSVKIPEWLKSYYGPEGLKNLSPEVVEEGKKYAIIKLLGAQPPSTYSKVGFVLISKNGRYGASPQEALFEGMPDMNDFFKMKSRLEKAEAGEVWR